MKIEHDLMTITLSGREQKLLLDEYNKLSYGEKDSIDLFKLYPNIDCLLSTIRTCGGNRACVANVETDAYAKK